MFPEVVVPPPMVSCAQAQISAIDDKKPSPITLSLYFILNAQLFELLFEHCYRPKLILYRVVFYGGHTEVSMVRFYSLVIFGCILTALSFGCGDGDGDASANNGAAPAQSCSGQSDCAQDYACVTTAGVSYCQPVCTASANECGASASCGSVGATSVNVCQPEDDSSDSNSSPEEAAPKPDEQPKLPCSTDADCAQFDAGAICAEFEGEKDCTIPCTQESDCDVPAIGGFSVDFLTCLPDESNTMRSACVPDAACFANPLDCVTLPDPTDFGDGFPTDGEDGGDGFGGDGFDGDGFDGEGDPSDEFDF